MPLTAALQNVLRSPAWQMAAAGTGYTRSDPDEPRAMMGRQRGVGWLWSGNPLHASLCSGGCDQRVGEDHNESVGSDRPHGCLGRPNVAEDLRRRAAGDNQAGQTDEDPSWFDCPSCGGDLIDLA